MNIIEKEFNISATKNKNTIRVLLPDDYHRKDTFYPVLYMHDSLNLYEDKTYIHKTSWKIHETLRHLKEKRMLTKDLIIVGIDNPDLKQFEYSPDISKDLMESMLKVQMGGLCDVYAEFLMRTVKPYIEKNFRALEGYDHTFIAGSSLGAYVSTYIAAKYPTKFKSIASFSLISWFNENDFLSFIKYSSLKPETKIFISVGINEFKSRSKFNKIHLSNSQNLKTTLEDKLIQNIFYIETNSKDKTYPWEKVFTHYLMTLLKK